MLTSTPTGASVKVDDVSKGMTPLVVKVRRDVSHTVEFNKPGYEPATMNIVIGTSHWQKSAITLDAVLVRKAEGVSSGGR